MEALWHSDGSTHSRARLLGLDSVLLLPCLSWELWQDIHHNVVERRKWIHVKCSEQGLRRSKHFVRMTHTCTYTHPLLMGLKVCLANLQNHFHGCQEILSLCKAWNFTLQQIHIRIINLDRHRVNATGENQQETAEWGLIISRQYWINTAVLWYSFPQAVF